MKGAALVFFFGVIGCTYAHVSLTGFRAKFGATPNVDSFYQLPKNVQEANSLGFRDVPYRSDRGYNLVLKCANNDFRVCLLFNRGGSVAGMQFAIPREDVDITPYNTASHFKLKSIQRKDFWTGTIYYESPETIRSGGRRGPVTETIEGLWLENGNELINVPLSERDLSRTFVKQNCVAKMGTHYYLGLNPKQDCKDMFPYFILVKSGKVIGYGIGFNGHTKDVTQKWHESFPVDAIKMLMPAAPACLEDWGRRYGVIQLHTYFNEKPWDMTCEAGDYL